MKEVYYDQHIRLRQSRTGGETRTVRCSMRAYQYILTIAAKTNQTLTKTLDDILTAALPVDVELHDDHILQLSGLLQRLTDAIESGDTDDAAATAATIICSDTVNPGDYMRTKADRVAHAAALVAQAYYDAMQGGDKDATSSL